MTDELKGRIGFAIGAGMVPAIVALVMIRVILGEWGLAFLAGIVVWLIVGAVFWNKHNR